LEEIKMGKYRKKPVIVEARMYNGNRNELLAKWCGGKLIALGQGFWKIEIDTLEGTMTASPGDFIVRGVNGEFYPCKPAIFEKTYEEVAE
jgi:hypothetical protein